MNKKSILFFICLQWVVGISNAQWDSVGPNPRGKYILDNFVKISALYAYKGDLIVGGGFDTIGDRIPAPGIGLWNGTAWDTIPSGVQYPSVFGVYNGNLVALGYYFPQESLIAQWNGSEWDSVGDRLSSIAQWTYLNALCEYNGRLYAAGTFYVYPDGSTSAVMLDSNKWGAFPYGNYLPIGSMTVYNGKLYLGGEFNINGMHNIASWNDTVLAPVGGGIGSSGSISVLFVWNGKLYAGGLFDSAGGQPARNIAVWDGYTWSPLGKGVNGSINAVTVYNDTLVIGGEFNNAGGILCNSIAKWDGANWSALGSGVIFHVKGPRQYGIVNSLCAYNGALYVGGQFDSAGGIYALNIARWGTPDNTDTAIYTGSLRVYPNPSNGIFTLQENSQQSIGADHIEIYNALGQKIYTANLSPGLNEINLTGKASGIYIYNVTSPNGNTIKGELLLVR